MYSFFCEFLINLKLSPTPYPKKGGRLSFRQAKHGISPIWKVCVSYVTAWYANCRGPTSPVHSFLFNLISHTILGVYVCMCVCVCVCVCGMCVWFVCVWVISKRKKEQHDILKSLHVCHPWEFQYSGFPDYSYSIHGYQPFKQEFLYSWLPTIKSRVLVFVVTQQSN